LLNTLAQRINFGVVSGDFQVDGRPLPKSFQRATGFAEQMDVHEPTATIREALQFSALLRQPKEVPVKEKYEYCERIIDLLEMRNIAGATIGKIGQGLNQEQRKRGKQPPSISLLSVTNRLPLQLLSAWSSRVSQSY